MKKIILIILSCLLLKNVFSQSNPYPVPQNLGNTPTTVVIGNAIKERAYMYGFFVDTTAANAYSIYLKTYPFATIATSSPFGLWMRNAAGDAWVLLGGGSGAITALTNGLTLTGSTGKLGGNLTQITTIGGSLTYPLNIDALTSFKAEASNGMGNVSSYIAFPDSATVNGASKIHFRIATNEKQLITGTGVGIGTTAPSTLLHINGANGLRYVDGNQALNSILVSSATGVASWSATLPSGLALKKVYAPFVVSNDSISQRFNVLKYGAVPDGVTDCTTPIQNAINAAFAAGGGTIYFPNGHYIVSGALITSIDGVNPNCQIYIPLTTGSGPMITIKLQGESPPSFANSGLVDYPINAGGVIIESTIRGSGTRPALLGTSYYNTGFGNFNVTDTWVDNINFRVRSKTSGNVDTVNTMSGINFETLGSCVITNTVVNIQSNIFNSSQPKTGTIGVAWPGLNNGAYVSGANVQTTGFDVGQLLNEHLDGFNLISSGCHYGFQVLNASHDLHVSRMMCNWDIINVDLSGSNTALHVDEFATEHYEGAFGAKWYTFSSDVNVTAGLPHLDINYWVGISGVGINNGDWTTNMTSNLNAQVIGGVSDRYIQNKYSSLTSAQTQSSAYLSDTLDVLKNVGIGLAPNAIKSRLHLAGTGNDARLSVEFPSGSYGNIFAVSNGTSFQFPKSKSFVIERLDSINDVQQSKASFYMEGNKGHSMFMGITSQLADIAQLGVIPDAATTIPFAVRGFGGQSVPLTKWEDGSLNLKAKITQTGGGYFADTLQTPNVILKPLDTTNYKLDVINSTGSHFEMNWPTGGGGSGLTIGNAVTGGGASRVLYEDASQNLAASAGFKYDGTNVGIGSGFGNNYPLNVYNGTAAILQLQNSTSGTGASDGLLIDAEATANYLYGFENIPLKIYTNGSQKMQVGSDGKLIVGSAAVANYELNLNNGGASTFMQITTSGSGTGGADGMFFGLDGSSHQIYCGENLPLGIYTNGTLRMTIGAAGSITIPDLAGTGVRGVTASATGVLAPTLGTLNSTVASADLTAQSAAVASVATYTPGADGTYRIGAYITITAISVNTITAQVTYTDETNTSRTQSFFAQGLTSAALATTGAFAFPTMDIRVKSGTAITVLTSTVGAGSQTYDVGASVEKLR